MSKNNSRIEIRGNIGHRVLVDGKVVYENGVEPDPIFGELVLMTGLKYSDARRNNFVARGMLGALTCFDEAEWHLHDDALRNAREMARIQGVPSRQIKDYTRKARQSNPYRNPSLAA